MSASLQQHARSSAGSAVAAPAGTAAPRRRAGLLAHTSTYGLGNLLVTLAGLITFPLLTRAFTPAEYGLISLVSATLLLLVSIGKLGIQHSSVRFYSEVAVREGQAGLRRFHATVTYGMVLVGLVAAVACVAAGRLLPTRWWGDSRVADLLVLAAFLLLIRVFDSGMQNVLRAREQSGAITVYLVIKRYFSLLLVVIAVLVVAGGLQGYFLALVLAEAAAALALLAWLWSSNPYRPRDFSPRLFRTMLAFGIPMVAYEASGMLLEIGDRYVINALLGAQAVGLYSAAYNLCDYVKLVFVASMIQAVQPMYVRIWAEQGGAAVQEFLQRALHYYLLAGCAIAAGVAAVAPELIVLLASRAYGAGAAAVPAVIVGILVSGLAAIVGAGLYIAKRTGLLVLLVAASVVVNLALNLVLVPRFGIVGAAQATLITHVLLTLAIMTASHRFVPLRPPWATFLKLTALSLLMYVVVTRIRIEPVALGLLVKTTVGALVYVGLVVVCDAPARIVARRGIAGLFAWGASRLTPRPAP